MGVGVVHPHLELLFGRRRAGGVVGGADIDQVGHLTRGQLGEKAVFRGAGQVDQLRPLLPVVVPRPARHGVGVHVDGVNRIAHRHHIVHREDIADAAAVGLGPVGHEDLVVSDIHTPGLVVVPDGEAEEIVGAAGLLAVAPEGLLHPHLLGRLHHGVHHRGGQGQGHVANAQPDQGQGRVLDGKGPHPAADFREQVSSGELFEILVDAGHGDHSLLYLVKSLYHRKNIPVNRQFRHQTR